MKTVAVLVASLATAAAFAPAPVSSRVGMELAAKKSAEETKPFFETVFGMDLFAPNPTVNNYGARSKKNLKQGKLSNNSYVPAGLSRQQYEKIRSSDQKKKDENYKKNVAKAGKFIDFTDWYLKRGTNLDQKWVNSATKGHNMVKTKYDFSGKSDEQKSYDGRS